MHRSGLVTLVLSCLCSAGVASCGGEPGDSASASASTGGEGASTSAGTVATAASAGPTSGGTTTGDSDASQTGGEDTVTGGATTTTGSDTTGGDTTAGGESTSGRGTTSTGAVSTTDDDSTSTGADDPWNCEGGEPVTVNGQGKYSTLAAAVAAAPPDATITVCAGTYQEGVVIDRPLTLLGAGQDKTFLDGGGETTPIFINAVSVTIEGFTFQHGKAVHPVQAPSNFCGGGLGFKHEFNQPMTVTVKDCTFTDNHARYGGAICADGSDSDPAIEQLILEHVTITGNSAEYDGGGVWSFAPTTITDSTIVDNSAVERGGGIFVDYADDFIVGGAVKHNTAGKGGGMYIGSSVTVDVTASDWGFGQDQENVPNDVEHYIVDYGFFGADVSFYCEGLDWNKAMCALK